MEQAERLCDELNLLHEGKVRLSGTLEQVRGSEGRLAVHVRYRLLPGRDLAGIPGVEAVSDHGQEAELTLAPGADPTRVLRAVLDRAEVTRFEAREPSLHEVFKRIAGAEG
jgi:ABC-2 type transport system ATP-binding protein